MADEIEDVKTEVDTSTTSTDVKAPAVETSTTDDHDKLIGDVLKKYPQEDEKKEESSESGFKSKPDKEEKADEKVEEAKEEVADKTDEKAKEHEETVPYERFAEVNTKVKEYEEPATRMRGIEWFCQQNSIAPEQFHLALNFLATVKADPKKAREMISPLIEQLDIALGSVLPTDLQQRVADGKLDEETAKEMAQLRLKANGLEHSTKLSAQQQAQNAQQQIWNTLNEWDKSRQGSNPEFKPKAKESDQDGLYEAFQAKLVFLWNTVGANDVNGAVKLAEKAYDSVAGFVKQYKAVPKARKVLSASGTSSNAEPEIDTDKPGWQRQLARKVTAGYK